MITLAWWQIVGALLLAAIAGTLMGAWLMYEADRALEEPRLVDDDVWGDDD
jgi:hypothetical protein